jgi:hypothetical protein
LRPEQWPLLSQVAHPRTPTYQRGTVVLHSTSGEVRPYTVYFFPESRFWLTHDDGLWMKEKVECETIVAIRHSRVRCIASSMHPRSSTSTPNIAIHTINGNEIAFAPLSPRLAPSRLLRQWVLTHPHLPAVLLYTTSLQTRASSSKSSSTPTRLPNPSEIRRR